MSQPESSASNRDPPPVRVTLLLRLDQEPIAGRVQTDDVDEPFVGWLGLATLIERLRTQAYDRGSRIDRGRSRSDG